jgi:FkbM family methyltransferase
MRLSTAWGGCLFANPTHCIGLSIHNTGVYDLAASEAIVRLVEPGDTVVDGGANIGYMSVLAGYVSRRGGAVISFEPHPALFSFLRDNTVLASEMGDCAQFDLRQLALGQAVGKAWLNIPDGFEHNDGLASLVPSTDTCKKGFEVAVTTLDEAIGERQIALLKLDIEGYEAEALNGANISLKKGRIKHVLFEDHALGQGESTTILMSHGYTIFSLGWSLHKPMVQPVSKGILSKDYEAPNFIATLDSGRLLELFRPAGWQVLGNLPKKQPIYR